MRLTPGHRVCVFGVLPVLAASCVDWEKSPAPAPLATTSAPTSSHYELRVAAKSRWRIHSNLRAQALAVDGDSATCAQSAGRDCSGCWVLVDFQEPLTFQAVELVHGQARAHPRRYRVEVSESGWPYVRVFEGLATDGRTIAILKESQTVRFMKITSLEGAGRPWQLAEINLY